MSEWQAGDLALCIYDENWKLIDGPPAPGAIFPAKGRIYRVLFVERDPRGPFLNLEECDPFGLWNAARFRKIEPDSEPGSEIEWMGMLNRHRAKVPA